jgi:mono/diheme cytochrome c family protein
MLQIIAAVTNGIGVMQAWENILTYEEIEAVAYYVFSSTNK